MPLGALVFFILGVGAFQRSRELILITRFGCGRYNGATIIVIRFRCDSWNGGTVFVI